MLTENVDCLQHAAKLLITNLHKKFQVASEAHCTLQAVDWSWFLRGSKDVSLFLSCLFFAQLHCGRNFCEFRKNDESDECIVTELFIVRLRQTCAWALTLLISCLQLGGSLSMRERDLLLRNGHVPKAKRLVLTHRWGPKLHVIINSDLFTCLKKSNRP